MGIKQNKKTGQTLVTLLIFMIIGITITTASVVMVIVNSRNISRIEQGNDALGVAESGVEDAVLRLLRDPSITNTSWTLTVGSSTTTVQITSTGGTQRTITSTAVAGNFTRKVQVDLTLNGQLTINSWQETF